MARAAKLNNPHLLAVNPFTNKKGPTTKKRNSKPKVTKSTKKNPSTVRAQRNPNVADIVKKGGAAAVGALATTFVANLLPLPVNPLFNAAAKCGVGVAIGYAANMISATKGVADFVMAGGVGVGAADALRFFAPKLRTIIVPSEPQATAIKEGTQGQLNDVVVVDDGLMGDVVDSMPYNSEWAQ
ncbi:MAG TPA: hypothetical protein PLD20_05790 [Blastocatellia bacterium]|nr:hypothetical protein [Blastocatellia bacterium]HMV87614.1 hypothetical protein [Blastocatellia bacterium]HMX24720.1 hypothetical protein [Blastocatellia bacterium]HMY74916.1 hypothetical protein [Blastocatellia bacterium]HMZ17419.1 hypothetical protein [Blastocatellia bacterium]